MSKKAKTTRRDSTGSDEADHPRLDDVMDLKFESGTAVDQVNAPSDKKAAGLQKKPETEEILHQIRVTDSMKQAAIEEYLSQCTMTENGQRILAHRRVGSNGLRFLVKTGPDEFGLISGSDIGRRSQKKYFAGKVIRNATDASRAGEEKVTEDNYGGVAIVASSPFKSKVQGSKTGYPETYAGVFVKVANGYDICLVTRTVLRSAIGKGDADMDIDNYYKKNQFVAPWTVGPQRVLQRSVKLVEEPTKDFLSASDKMLSSGNTISSDAEASVSKSEVGLDILE